MATSDKVKNTGQQVKGKLKETVGRASGDNKLRAEGKADQMKGNVKQAGEKLKDHVQEMTPAQQIEIDVLDIDGQRRPSLSDRRPFMLDERSARK